MFISDNGKERLARIVHYYTSNRKLPDDNFYNTVFYILLDDLQLHNYVKSLTINNLENDMDCFYDFDDKSISMNAYNMIKIFIKDIKNKNIYADANDILLNICLNIINSMIHEFSHANQFKTFYEDKQSIEKELIATGFEKQIKTLECFNDHKKLKPYEIEFFNYLENYGSCAQNMSLYITNPCERMANIDGLQTEYDVCKIINPKNKSVIDYEKYKLLNGQLLGYSKSSAPTVFYKNFIENLRNSILQNGKYFDYQEYEYQLKKLAYKNNLSDDDLYYYGFPVCELSKQAKEEAISRIREKINK